MPKPHHITSTVRKATLKYLKRSTCCGWFELCRYITDWTCSKYCNQYNVSESCHESWRKHFSRRAAEEGG